MKPITKHQVGQNLNLVIDGKSYSKKIAEKDAREEVKAKIDEYNSLLEKKTAAATKKAEKLLKEIVLAVTGNVVKKEKEEKKKEIAKKSVAKKIKKEEKTEDKKVKTGSEEVVDSMSEVKKKIETGSYTDDELKELETLINKNKKVQQEKAPEAKVTEQPRRGEYRH